jgi:starvation-inducible DNA-binding protein
MRARRYVVSARAGSGSVVVKAPTRSSRDARCSRAPAALPTRRQGADPIPPDAARNASAERLQAVLVELQHLALQTRQSEFNVSGPRFYALLLVLEAQGEALRKAADRCADRLLALGFPVDLRATTTVRCSRVAELEVAFLDERATVMRIAAGCADVIATVRAAEEATLAADPATATVLAEVAGTVAAAAVALRAEAGC